LAASTQLKNPSSDGYTPACQVGFGENARETRFNQPARGHLAKSGSELLASSHRNTRPQHSEGLELGETDHSRALSKPSEGDVSGTPSAAASVAYQNAHGLQRGPMDPRFQNHPPATARRCRLPSPGGFIPATGLAGRYDRASQMTHEGSDDPEGGHPKRPICWW